MRRPLLRFALLGALLFAVAGEVPERAGPPAPAGGGGDEALLLGEALARGYHRSDPLVQRRLAMNLRFARGDDGRTDAALAAEAIALGMHETDLVVRRRLVQKMELLAHGRARLREPDEAALARQRTQQESALRLPSRARLSVVTARAEDETAHLSRRSAAQPGDPSALAGAGGPLPFPSPLPPLSSEEVAGLFGADFAWAVEALPEGHWSAPIRSVHGFHLVFVHERIAAGVPSPSALRASLREVELVVRGERALARDLAALRGRVLRVGETAP